MRLIKSSIAIFLLGIISCQKPNRTHILSIDAQSNFNGEEVIIWIDNREALHENLQTELTLGLCVGNGQTKTSAKEGTHEIKVQVGPQTNRTEQFRLTKDLFIGVNYNKSLDKISFIYSNERFIYD